MSNKLESTATIQLEEKTYFDNVKMVASRANRYESYIVLESESKTVNGKSILGLSSFLSPSENVTLRAIGHDSRQAVQDIKHLFTHA
ncbi:HPr family phosphocarrier protein [Salibacterium lacus]|uniref:HPr family phosphocarrier protein n=1 Tax=Salibacterium lacus TaxID=1898109 RepID=A0ABW5SYI6_9BACI